MKYIEVRKLYKDTIEEITKSTDNWLSFLKSASWNFKYNFDDQILIYAQKPDATACAEMEEWNNKVKPRRWVNKNSKGIAIFSKEGSELPLRFVFDLADTHNNRNTPYKLWEIKQEYEEEIINSLEAKFGDINSNGTLTDALYNITFNMVSDSISDYLETIEKYKKGTSLENLDEAEIKPIFLTTVWASVLYMTLNRCGLNADKYIDKSEFQHINFFKNNRLTTILGTATRDISEIGLREIAKTVRNLQTTNRTFALEKNTSYPINVNENIEGGNENEQYTIPETRRLSNSQYNNGGGETSNREIRNNEIELSKNTQQIRIHDNENGENIEQTPNRDTGNGDKDDKTNGRTDGKEGERDRRTKTKRPDEVDRTNEQLQNYSGRTSNERTDLQLNLFENNIFEINDRKETGNIDISNLEKNYKLSNGNYFHFHTNEEGYYYSIYDKYGVEQDGGLLEYSENETNQTLIDVRRRLAEFTEIKELEDENLEEVSKDFIDELIQQEVFLNEEDHSITIKNKEPLNKEINKQEKINYHIDNNSLGEGTPKEKVKKNIEAIKVLKKCEEENRYATIEEQKIMSNYVGWGGLPDVFDTRKDEWHNENEQLKALLTEKEYKEAKESTLTSFYTPPIVIKAIYETLERMGLKKGNILEPSCGIGNFMGMLPNTLQGCKIYGVESDTISGKIARQLYQKNTIAIQGFEDADLPDTFFDVAVGNVPFGDFRPYDKRYDKYKFQIHDYFFAKTLDKVRPNGVVAFITSKGTLDKENSSVRKYICQRAELLGAIRLPNNTFKKNAGTVVTSDIIFLKKRDRITDIEEDWVELAENEDGIRMNKYFVDNPDMILGKMEMTSTQFGMDSTCTPYDNANFQELLEYATEKIYGEIDDYQIDVLDDEKETSIPATSDVRNFSYTIVDEKIYYRENSKMYLQTLPLTTTNRIKEMIKIRDSVRKLIELQTNEESDEEINSEQKHLNNLYDSFVKKYGIINSRGNEAAFSEDDSYYLLCSLEIVDEKKQFIRKADMFYKRTIKPNKVVSVAETAVDALILSISNKARVDIEYMSSLTGQTEQELVKELEGSIYKDPMLNTYVTADEYLSGNVREKLKISKQFAENNPEYKINVEGLERVKIKDLSASEISVRLGATWIPPSDIEDFIFYLIEPTYYAKSRIHVNYSQYTSEWNISGKSEDRGNEKANSTYGTKRMNAYKIIEQTLNLKDIRIFDTIIDLDGNEQKVLNPKETAIAQAKQEMIKSKFDEWIWSDQERRNRLTTLYNEKFNCIKPREYDGQYITFGGINPEITLRLHQSNAIARILYGGNTLLAHEVGAGKTFEMVAGAMESKRIGLCNKSLFVVPNHIIEQFASEFLQLYPSANILVTTKKDFATNNRKKFCSKIATGEYDAIIIGHSQFEKIPM